MKNFNFLQIISPTSILASATAISNIITKPSPTNKERYISTRIKK